MFSVMSGQLQELLDGVKHSLKMLLIGLLTIVSHFLEEPIVKNHFYAMYAY